MNNQAQHYNADSIEVLEGLEPVRMRPGMYIGGTDSNAMHHLMVEVLDNSMDEAVAGHADKIWVTLFPGNKIAIRDNGRGIPVDPHPKYPTKSALEIILCTLHAGGKFNSKAYSTSGGLHGVGISVVNALSSHVRVEVARGGTMYAQEFSRGKPLGGLQQLGPVTNKRGTEVTFIPDEEIFSDTKFNAKRLRDIVRSKTYLYRGVTIQWRDETGDKPHEEIFHYPGGLEDYVKDSIGDTPCLTDNFFAGLVNLHENRQEIGRLEWAMAWPVTESGHIQSYANTIPTPQGGTHETGMRAAVVKSLRQYAEMRGKKADKITADDVLKGAQVVLSIFLPDVQFQGQTKDKLTSSLATRLTENALKDAFDLWLANDTESADALMFSAIERAEERARRKKEQEVIRKTAVSRRLRLPGKLADCSNKDAKDTEIFIVEGDSAGGSAKQARDRRTQAILPLRGKILNVVSATKDKLAQNNELRDLAMALGCGTGKECKVENLRYERVIIMTDADVDGAHIATLLMSFFYEQMHPILTGGFVYLALPPLYKLTHGAESVYAQDDADKDRHLASTFKGKKNVEISRFKGLGEMPAAQLKETTMDPTKRKLMQVNIHSLAEAQNTVRRLMGKNPEDRLMFIRENATETATLDI